MIGLTPLGRATCSHLLRECDVEGRVSGAVVGTVGDEALDYLRKLERSNG